MASNKTPLKLTVEPDEYLCTWFIPGPDGAVAEYSGSIDLKPDRQPTGSVHGTVPIARSMRENGLYSIDFPQNVELPHLRARLVSGYDVDLVDVSIIYWFEGRGRIHAGSATVGVPSDPQDRALTPTETQVPTYSRVSVQVGALDAVAGAAPFSRWEFPQRGAGMRHLEGNWTVSGNPDSTQTWTDNDFTVCFEYVGSASIGNPYMFRFVVSPVVRIQSGKGLTVREWVDRWVVPLRRILSIATGSAQPLTYMAAEDNGSESSSSRPRQYRQVYGSGITQGPYISDQVSVRESSSSVRISIDHLSLLEMLKHWQALEDDHHPLIETYGAMLSANDEHPRSRFLLLVQALEGLYGHETRDDYEVRKGRHKADRDRLLETVKTASVLSPEDFKFLKKNLARQPMRGLNQALAHLLGELPVDLTPELKDCELLAEYLAEAGGSDAQRVASALSRVRNDLAHGNKGFDAHDLLEVVKVLELIVRAHALRLLGCPNSVLERVCTMDR
ncbi:HEPN domain-containing protein [Arthrobacter sunyaminii]|uniref:HEPN domain-containing protein n=1 Tax=Arthrobacter sunyaminii TaxID=2816859 RepID=UPI001A953678|nr:HEPN domain-containing protein [Arthrobacter sunyaminii]MBO0895337.1 hypothetical protein [Arthrobacter sunyaminii]